MMAVKTAEKRKVFLLDRAKTVARIEQGKVKRIYRKTLNALVKSSR